MSTSFYGAHGEEQRIVRRGSSDQFAVCCHLCGIVQVGCEITAPFKGINTYFDAGLDRLDGLIDVGSMSEMMVFGRPSPIFIPLISSAVIIVSSLRDP